MLMSRKGKHLVESQGLDVITKMSGTAPTNERSPARKHGVSEGAIQKIWENREAIQKQCVLKSEETKTKKL